jgi:hypothetical protein
MPKATPQLFVQLIEALLELHDLELIRTLSLTLHAEILIHELTAALARLEVLRYLTMRINERGLYDFVPLAAFIAMNIGDDAIAQFIENLTPHTLAVVPRFWIVALAEKSIFDVRTKVWKFIIACQGCTAARHHGCAQHHL